jgi:hypothetical protein
MISTPKTLTLPQQLERLINDNSLPSLREGDARYDDYFIADYLWYISSQGTKVKEKKDHIVCKETQKTLCGKELKDLDFSYVKLNEKSAKEYQENSIISWRTNKETMMLCKTCAKKYKEILEK